MYELISPDYNLEAFCYRMMSGDPLTIAEAASAEISHARKLHREKTKDTDFRVGSKGQAYCEQLQWLIFMLVNGQVPARASVEFRESVRPLMTSLLQKWDIGDLRREFLRTRT